MTDWFDELDLDPGSTWRRMGTRALGDRPWLVADGHRAAELALRAGLLDRKRDDVLVCPAVARDAAREVVALVQDAGFPVDDGIVDPLEAAGRAVQEDLCLLRHRDGAWHLDAACLCFPSRWRLADKIGLPLVGVHHPTPGYAVHLSARVDHLLDHLGERPVLRRNWFVHPDPALHQPDAPADDPVVPAPEILTGLHLRSERQTLRRLPSGWVLFTIRIQQDTLGTVLAEPARWERFAAYVAHASAEDLTHRGMAPAQVRELRTALLRT